MKSNLQSPARLLPPRQRRARVGKIQRQRLFAQYVFPRAQPQSPPPAREICPASRSTPHPDPCAQHRIQAAVAIVDFEFLRNLARAFRRSIRNPHQSAPPAPAAADSPRGACPSPQHPPLQLPAYASERLPKRSGFLISRIQSRTQTLNSAANALLPPPRGHSQLPRKYFKLAAMLCAGGIGVAPNFTSCSTTDQPE